MSYSSSEFSCISFLNHWCRLQYSMKSVCVHSKLVSRQTVQSSVSPGQLAKQAVDVTIVNLMQAKWHSCGVWMWQLWTWCIPISPVTTLLLLSLPAVHRPEPLSLPGRGHSLTLMSSYILTVSYTHNTHSDTYLHSHTRPQHWAPTTERTPRTAIDSIDK